MRQTNARAELLRSGMGCFLFACAASLVNVLLFPFARELYGYPASVEFVSFILSVFAFYALGRVLRRLQGETLERIARIAVPSFLCAMFILHLILGYMMAYTPSGDNRSLLESARLLAADGNFDAQPDYYLYMSRYSNQWGFLLMLTALFKLFGIIGLSDFLFPLVVLQAALYVFGFLASLSIARRICGVRGVLTLIAILTLCMPLYLAAAVLYTDTFSLPFVMMTLCFALRALESKTPTLRITNAILASLIALLGAQIKMTVLIALIAALIVWLLSMRTREAICCCAVSVAIVIGGILGAQGIMTSRVLDPEMVAQHHTPAIHWVMMSIPTSDNPYGGYNSGDYAKTWGMMERGEPHDEVMATVYERIRDRIYTLRYPNRLILAMLRKNSAIVGDGTFGMTEMLDDGPVRENAISQVVLEQRPYYALYSAVCTGIFMAHMAFAALACLRDIRARDTRRAMLYIAMFGILLFLMLWEARSRYMFGFVPVLLLLSCAMIARNREEENEA